MMNNVVLHLSLLEGIGAVTIQRIFETFKHNLSEVHSLNSSDFVARCGLSHQQADKIVAGLANRTVLDEERLLLEKNGITTITMFDDCYPQSLRAIYAPPPILYMQGSLPETTKGLAIVGSRKAHLYAKSVLDAIVPPLIDRGWHSVSGGARGTDTFAHQVTIAASGKTYAILGSGLLHRYPYENNKLFDEIIATGGALMSPFPLRQVPLPGNFPARNRIIAGLSKGCLVVQAAQKSGASITAHHALEQGKDVFVVPGRIDDPLNVGSHQLIQEGAKLVTNVHDILVEFNDTFNVSASIATTAGHVVAYEEDSVVALCRDPISFDDLLVQSGFTPHALQAKLFDLQLEGKVQQNHVGLWHML